MLGTERGWHLHFPCHSSPHCSTWVQLISVIWNWRSSLRLRLFLRKSNTVPCVPRSSVSERLCYRQLTGCWWTWGGGCVWEADSDTPDVPADHFSMPTAWTTWEVPDGLSFLSAQTITKVSAGSWLAPYSVLILCHFVKIQSWATFYLLISSGNSLGSAQCLLSNPSGAGRLLLFTWDLELLEQSTHRLQGPQRLALGLVSWYSLVLDDIRFSFAQRIPVRDEKKPPWHTQGNTVLDLHLQLPFPLVPGPHSPMAQDG